MSLISALLCRETGRGDSGIACTYGLFRDCGMPVMLQKYPIYADIFDASALTPGEPALEVENERYPTNHARVGAQLARSWHLPQSLCLAILRHHGAPYPDTIRLGTEVDALMLIAIGLTAEQIYCGAIGAVSHDWAFAGDWALSELDLTRDKFGALAARVNASINRL
jgi:HD-like signal output (HDOD) protein